MLKRLLLALLVFLILLSTQTYAIFYNYDQKIEITDSSGSIGYVQPYKISSVLGDYTYLKWKRDGYSEGDTFPVTLIKGTTLPLIFGVELEFLNVRINDITSTGVDLTIDKSNLQETIETTVETIPESVESIVEETQNSINTELEEFNNELNKRIIKSVNRGYYSSLHIVDSQDYTSISVSNSIEQKEALLAEKIADKIIPMVIDAFVSGTFPVTGVMYNQIVQQIPSSIRHEMTNYLLNIDTHYDTQHTNSGLANKAVFSLYIGNPSVNSLSNSMNIELKNEGLPYFENGKIVGKRTYSEDSIGIIAAIPEEKVWTSNTLQNRWDNDRVRLYKTMIAGISDEGTETAGKWYNDQLDLVRKLITNALSLEGDVDLNEVLNVAKDTATSNPEASIGSATLLQGWTLTAMNSLQNPDLDNFDSLGYVIIVKKDATGYDVLEIHTINGYKSNVYLNEYDFEEIEEIIKTVENIEEIAEEPEKFVDDIVEENTEQISGEVIKKNEEISIGFIERIEVTIKSILMKLFGGWF